VRCSWVAALAILSLSGCAALAPTAADTAPVPEDVRRAVRTVAVVPVSTKQGGQFAPTAAVGTGEGARQGLATGAAGGLVEGLRLSLGTGPLAPAAALIFVPVGIVAGAVGGGAVGAATSVPKPVAEQATSQLDRHRDTLSTLLAQDVVARLPTVGKEAVEAQTAMPQTRLEVSLDHWGLAGGSGADPMMSFFIAASWRLVPATGTTAPAVHRLSIQSVRRPISAWTADDAAALRRAVTEAIAGAAETIVESAFLVQKFQVAGQWDVGGYCGLEPYAPVATFALPTLPLKPPVAASTTPALQWQPFPTDHDRKGDAQALLPRVSRIRYDLRLWAAVVDRPQWVDRSAASNLLWLPGVDQADYRAGDLVYERSGLELVVVTRSGDGAAAETPPRAYVEHRIDAPLLPGTVYLWSVRARFLLDGEERVTPWSFRRSDGASRPIDCASDAPHAGHFFRFRTP